MSNWPLASGFSDIEAFGGDTSDSSAVTVTLGTRTLGSWVEIAAATSFEYGAFRIFPSPANEGFMEIGIGTGGNEVTVATILMVMGGNADFRRGLTLPISIPSGARVAVRGSIQTTGTAEVSIVGIARAGLAHDPKYAFGAMFGVERAGGSTTHARKVAVDPGGTANTKGSWVEIVASLDDDYHGLLLMFDDNQVGTQTAQNRLWSFAIGGSGSEIPILEDVHQVVAVSETAHPVKQFFAWRLPSGTRIAAQMQSSIIDASDRMGGCAVLGFK